MAHVIGMRNALSLLGTMKMTPVTCPASASQPSQQARHRGIETGAITCSDISAIWSAVRHQTYSPFSSPVNLWA